MSQSEFKVIGDVSLMDRINKETELPLGEPSKTFPDDSVDAWLRPEELWLSGHCSLTKREYFAAMALQGFIARGYDSKASAQMAVLCAASLITELNKK